MSAMKAAEENRDELSQLVALGHGLCHTAEWEVAQVLVRFRWWPRSAEKSGALTIAVITKPFTFEGRHRTKVAEEGIARLASKCDTMIIIPNDKLLSIVEKNTSVEKPSEKQMSV